MIDDDSSGISESRLLAGEIIAAASVSNAPAPVVLAALCDAIGAVVVAALPAGQHAEAADRMAQGVRASIEEHSTSQAPRKVQ